MTHSLNAPSSIMESIMKRLIVLTAFATLLASLSGCSILNQRGVQSCDATSPAPSMLSRFKLSNLLPWRSDDSLSGEECMSCNEGYSESGFVTDGYVDGGVISNGYTTTNYGGEIIQGSTIPSSGLYNPDVVGGSILPSTELIGTPTGY